MDLNTVNIWRSFPTERYFPLRVVAQKNDKNLERRQNLQWKLRCPMKQETTWFSPLHIDYQHFNLWPLLSTWRGILLKIFRKCKHICFSTGFDRRLPGWESEFLFPAGWVLLAAFLKMHEDFHGATRVLRLPGSYKCQKKLINHNIFRLWSIYK